MVYVIKLKLEFTVLNQLMRVTKDRLTERNSWRGGPSPELQNQGFGNNPSPRAKLDTWGTTNPASDAPVDP